VSSYYAVAIAAQRNDEIGVHVAVLRLDGDAGQCCRETAALVFPPDEGWENHYTTHYGIADAIIELERAPAGAGVSTEGAAWAMEER
jgi:hypothetical protein